MFYVTELIASLNGELKVVLGVLLFVVCLPLAGSLAMSHSQLPMSDILTTSELPRARTVALPVKQPTPIPSQTSVVTTHGATWPVKGIVTLEFGAPDYPYQPSHTGIDIAVKYGTAITAYKAGTVLAVHHLGWGYGNYIEVDHGNNEVSLYGHLSAIEVTPGQKVQPGDIIGRVGQSGWATGPHLHFELLIHGRPVNPRSYVPGSPSR
jgi:murein DD-endopeptidase MepM/ murein hydrolase activator NlpD